MHIERRKKTPLPRALLCFTLLFYTYCASIAPLQADPRRLPLPEHPLLQLQREAPKTAPTTDSFKLSADYVEERPSLLLPAKTFKLIKESNADELAAAAFERGVAHYDKKEYQLAAQAFKESALLNPLKAETHYYLANAYTILHKTEAAVQEYMATMRLDAKGQAGEYACEALADYGRASVAAMHSTVDYCWSGVYPSISWHTGHAPKGNPNWLKWNLRLLDTIAPYLQYECAELGKTFRPDDSTLRRNILCTVVYFEVTPKRKVTNITIRQSSIPRYDALVKRTVAAVAGSNALEFPDGCEHDVGMAVCIDFRRLWRNGRCECVHYWSQILQVPKK